MSDSQVVQNYSLGFLFDKSLGKVAVIKKTKPAWQAGLLNGIGGKVEPGETLHQCMVREFEEETGIHIAYWKRFGTLTFKHAEVALFVASSTDVYNVKTKTEENVEVISFWEAFVHPDKFIENVPSLLTLAYQRLKEDGD